jgi:uncharacterized membrane protein
VSEFQWDKLYLWLVGLSPLLAMVITLLARNWNSMSHARRRNSLLAAGIFFTAIFGFVAWSSRPVYSEVSAHIHVQHPLMLLIIVPLLGILLFLQIKTLSGISRGRMWSAFLIRGTIFNLLILALAGLQMVIERDTLSVLFALDCSKSVPESERQRALDFIKKAMPTKKSNDEAGLLVFGGKAMLEKQPSPLFSPPDAKNIKSVVNGDATDIAGALRISLSHLNESSRRRVVLFTDGGQTTGDAADALKRVVSVGADVWIVPLSRGNDAEMLIDKVVVPNELMWEQPFDAHVFVYSNITARARVKLCTGDKPGEKDPPSFEQTVDLIPGKNRVSFPGLRMHSGGSKEIKAVLEPLRREDDTLSENNEAYAFTDVQTENRILILTSDVSEVKYLLSALEDQKMTLDVRSGATLPDNPEAYRAYDCIVLANLARGFLSEQQMSVIQSCVEDQGAGLVMIGGDQSFGAGGYLGTPIEKVLPVDMDLQNQRVMPSGALCLVLHTCEFADGNNWAKKISKAAIKTLSPQDYAGLIYWGGGWSNGGGETWAFKPTLIGNRINYLFNLIDNCDPSDMPSLETIISMAVTALSNLKNVSLKHCIVITDGDPSPPTAATVAAAKNAKITISTISIFPHGGADVSVLKDVAAQTGGRYYSADDPRKLPQIFIKEAAVVRKSLIRSDDKGIPISLGTTGPTLKEFGVKFPDIRAFVVTQPKKLAEMQLFTVVEGEKVPILASWQHGLGKAVAFTSDATNRWAPEWVKWESYKKFWGNMFTWVSRQRMPSNHTITTRVEAGVAHVVVEGIDSKGDYLNFAKLAGNAIDPDVARSGADGQTYDLNFSMTAPGRYEATFPVSKAGAYSITVIDQSDPKRPNTIVTGLANSYSAEFAHQEGNDLLLSQLGDIATGKNTVSRSKDLVKITATAPECGVFAHDLPPAKEPSDLFWPLIVMALCLFPLDVAVRRLALDPEKGFDWAATKMAPVLIAMRLKKRQLQDAATEALAGSRGVPPPPSDIVPSGDASRAAQSRYEQAGGSADAQNIDLSPKADAGKKPVVGGTKLTQTDDAASDYTRALLKAKKRAKKKDD